MQIKILLSSDLNMLPSKDKPSFYYTDETNYSPNAAGNNNVNPGEAANRPLYNGGDDLDIQFRNQYENLPFKLFESAPRYGRRRNLMFQVRKILLVSPYIGIRLIIFGVTLITLNMDQFNRYYYYITNTIYYWNKNIFRTNDDNKQKQFQEQKTT